MIDLTKCKKITTSTFTGYVIGYNMTVPTDKVPDYFGSFNNLKDYIGSDNKIIIEEKQRIVEQFTGDIDNFFVVVYMIENVEICVYSYIIGNLPTLITSQVILDIVELYYNGCNKIYKKSDLSQHQYDTLSQHFELIDTNDGSSDYVAIRSVKVSMFINILVAIMYPFYKTYTFLKSFFI